MEGKVVRSSLSFPIFRSPSEKKAKGPGKESAKDDTLELAKEMEENFTAKVSKLLDEQKSQINDLYSTAATKITEECNKLAKEYSDQTLEFAQTFRDTLKDAKAESERLFEESSKKRDRAFRQTSKELKEKLEKLVTSCQENHLQTREQYEQELREYTESSKNLMRETLENHFMACLEDVMKAQLEAAEVETELQEAKILTEAYKNQAYYTSMERLVHVKEILSAQIQDQTSRAKYSTYQAKYRHEEQQLRIQLQEEVKKTMSETTKVMTTQLQQKKENLDLHVKCTQEVCRETIKTRDELMKLTTEKLLETVVDGPDLNFKTDKALTELKEKLAEVDEKISARASVDQAAVLVDIEAKHEERMSKIKQQIQQERTKQQQIKDRNEKQQTLDENKNQGKGWTMPIQFFKLILALGREDPSVSDLSIAVTSSEYFNAKASEL